MHALSKRVKNSVAAVAIAGTLAGATGVVVTASAIAASSTLVTTTDLNLRSGPGTGYAILDVIPSGASVSAPSGTSGSWIPVTYAGTSGYVSSSYVRIVATSSTTTSATGYVRTTSEVNVRSGAGTWSSVVAVADAGVTVQATGTTSGSWTEVIWNGTRRWISSYYLTAASAPAAQAPSLTVVGQRRTTDELNLRTSGYYGAPIWGVLPANAIVDITANTTSSYTQVVYQGQGLWVATAYLAPVTTASATAPTQATSTVGAQVVAYAKSKLGAPYSVGSMGPTYFDCAGLVSAAYQSAGVYVRYSMASQATGGQYVALADLQPGDVVALGSPVSAVSIYIGNDQLIIADGPAYGVRQVSLSARLKWTTFAGGHRFA